jgi:hypothetical protein
MSATPFTVIDEQQTHEVEAEVLAGEVKLRPAALEQALGWKLEDRGLCRAGACISVTAAPGLVAGDRIDLAKLATVLDRPIALDLDSRVAALAATPADRARHLADLEAPDFRLPDLQGRMHSLSEHRGKKVLLIAHASW